MMNNIKTHLAIASRITKLLDGEFRFFNWRFGLDPILGLIPGGGDAISLIISSYIVWIAVQVGLPFGKILEMIKNIFLDFFIGLVPLVGDVGDFFFKANVKNLEIINNHQSKYIENAEVVGTS